ncbi:MAG: hypothetical protein WBP41_04840 [Saprospiraceae bacterium]
MAWFTIGDNAPATISGPFDMEFTVTIPAWAAMVVIPYKNTADIVLVPVRGECDAGEETLNIICALLVVEEGKK